MEPSCKMQCQFAFWLVLIFFPLAHGDPTCIHLLVFSSRLKPPNSFPNGVCVSVEYMGMLLENVGDSPPQHKAEKALSQVISHLSRL